MTAERRTRGAVAAPGAVDPPTRGDHRRVRAARRVARARHRDIEAARAAGVLAAFRAEIRAAVRSASPLLVPMLAIEGMTLDAAVALIEPQIGWPTRPRLSGPIGVSPFESHLIRHFLAGLSPMPAQTGLMQISTYPLVGRRFDRVDGGFIQLELADHSLELEAQLGPVHVRTRFGELRIQLGFDLPHTLSNACVGKLVEKIVDHAVWRGRGWRIAAVEEGGGFCGQALLVLTGSVPYALPCPRRLAALTARGKSDGEGCCDCIPTPET